MPTSQTQMSAQETAKFFGVTKDTLRFYERKGLIPHVPRDEHGYRIYTDYELNWIYLVINLKRVGLSLEKIAQFAELFKNPTEESIQKQQEILRNQIIEIERSLHNLQTVKKHLQYKLDVFDEHFAKYESENLNSRFIEPTWKKFKK